MAGTFPISGQIEPKSFPFLVSDLHRNGATGSLKVEGPTYQKALYFRGGRVLFGSSNDPRDQLGAILIEDGRITPEQLEDVNSKVGPGNPLAKVLAETGFVSQRELSDAARAKVERILSDVIGYTSGTFEFEDGVLPKGAVDLKLSTERLVLTAVRRITDRTFVLRHLDGLDVVLRQSADLVALRTEIESETGGLLAQLDGVSTLKDAASRTRLDDFEAAKVACALLFLGAVERVGPGATGPLLDLGETAREALGEEWTSSPKPAAPPPPPRRRVGDDTIVAWGKIDPQAFAVPPNDAPTAPVIADPAVLAAAAVAAPAVPAPAPAAVPAVATPAPPAVVPAAEPELAIEPEPPAFRRTVTPAAALRPPTPPVPREPPRVEPPPPAPVVMPAPPPPAPAAVVAPAPPAPEPPAARVWTPPSARPAPTPARTATRPSKDDLAALDALLDPRTLEGPLEPLERAPEVRWTPPDRSIRARRDGTPASQRLALIGGFVAVAALGFAGVWYVLRKPAETGDARPSSPPTTVAALPVTTLPAARPSAPATAVPASTAATAAPAPTPRPTAATPAPVQPPPAAGVGPARALLRQGSLGEAARAFASNLRGAPAGAASIQLFVACSPETVQKAVSAVDAAELFILPVNYKGRDCYRMCWGIYESAGRAASDVGSLPDYFVKGGAAPRVMSRAELLP